MKLKMGATKLTASKLKFVSLNYYRFILRTVLCISLTVISVSQYAHSASHWFQSEDGWCVIVNDNKACLPDYLVAVEFDSDKFRLKDADTIIGVPTIIIEIYQSRDQISNKRLLFEDPAILRKSRETELGYIDYYEFKVGDSPGAFLTMIVVTIDGHFRLRATTNNPDFVEKILTSFIGHLESRPVEPPSK